MHERLVVCGGLKPSRGAPTDTLEIDVDAPKNSRNKVNLHLGDLSRPMADNIPDVLTDMLEIAAYVYCADQFTSRGSVLMTNMGADWRRRFIFKIPVRCSAIWARQDVQSALIGTLSFLSEDEFTFDFVPARVSTGMQPYLGFSDHAAQSFCPDEVMPFSGGLDSLAGAVDQLMGDQKKVALISHQSSTMVASKQNALVAALRQRTASGRLFYVPVSVNKGHEEAVEFTQRTRSLLFATLALVIAQMFNKDSLSFFENGIVSFNLPISEHVLGARASRTTHPRVLADFGRLFSLILSSRVTVRNPYLWRTKSEVIRVLADRECADLIAQTLSCTRVRQATQKKQHCGTCSQCIDRRFGILAANLGDDEPADTYVTDLFKGQHKPGSDLTMVESYVVRAQKLATMSEHAFVANYGQIFRAIPYLPDSPDDTVRQIFELHRRHGQEVITVIDRELQNNAGLNETLALPESSLLAMILSSVAKQPVYADPIEAEQTASAQANGDPWVVPPVQPLMFAIDGKAGQAIFRGGPELRGSGYDLVHALFREFEEDIKVGLDGNAFRFVSATNLAKRLSIDEQSLRQRVSRTRRILERQFLEKCDIQLDADDVIENDPWKGYRLNPYLLLVNVSQLHGR